MSNPLPLDSQQESTGERLNRDNSTVNEPEYVVGIGASAGGLEALEALFSHMPIKTGMAFVIVQHLSPDYKSLMDELLGRKTMIPIKVAVDQMCIEADTIYLLPPKKEMIAGSGRLYLTERENTEAVNLPINTFFRSLAESYQDKSIAIVLSGTGSDGSKGISGVHDSGGFVLAQTPETCKFDAMPVNAVNTHNVDLVLAPEDIPMALLKYSKRTSNVELQMSMGAFDAEVTEFSEVLVLLNNRYNLDFSQYKPSTISRRLERRLGYQKSATLREYIDLLLVNQDELEALYYDLLIGVTQFYRDKRAFNSLRNEIPKLLEEFDKEPEIRLWVAACATGQEAYSIAMLMTEVMEQNPQWKKPFKIFATDIHNKSIQFASAGLYEKDELQSLAPSLKERYFNLHKSGKFQVSDEIRKPILFAQHNLLKDPPFTRTQFVSCRNLLIYFNNAAQQRVLSLLTFSLMNSGILFLGPSESIGQHESDFTTLDSTFRLYRKTRDSQRRVDIPLSVDSRSRLSAKSFPMPSAADSKLSAKSKRAQEVLLQQYVPASVLIDDAGNILHVFGDAGDYLKIDFGTPSLNIRSLATGRAKAVLNQMIHQIGRSHKPLQSRSVSGFNKYDSVDVNVRLLSDQPGDQSYLIVSFEPTKVIDAVAEDSARSQSSGSVVDIQATQFSNDRIRELEEELQYSQESLQTTVEELETSNEELQATNEELMASNEELQSTNEELHSVNEELYTVNSEFQQKEIERGVLVSDERSMNQESNLGILFLDEELRVRKVSPAAAMLFNLLETDYGRPFSVASGSMVDGLHDDIRTVFHGGGLIEREVVDDDNRVYLIRINAHLGNSEGEKSYDVPFGGVVLTLTDISKYRALQDAQAKTQQRFHDALNAVSDGYFEWSFESQEVFLSHEVLQSLGYVDELPDLQQLLGDGAEKFVATMRHATHGIEIVQPFLCKNGDVWWMICKGRLLGTEGDAPEKFTGILIDYNDQKEFEDRLNRQAADLERSNELLEQFAHIVSHDMKAPLRHIQTYLEFLQDAIDSGDKDVMNKELEVLRENALGLDGLIDDIITYSRVTSEKKNVDDVNLNSIVDQVISTLSPLILSNNVQLQRSELPLMRGDEGLLTHLFQNLIGNACKYTDKKNPEVHISHEVENGHCIVSIRDNGIGFDEVYIERILAPFKRLVTKGQFEGTGLGLSICKTVVDQHHGTITINSTPGEGSCFLVSLPMDGGD